jgi:Asp-tRNA(Asn)/Glu-tRNA(Gln) amidotransferase B subunit
METMSLKLDKNIQIPQKGGRRKDGKPTKYSAVNKAEVGDSVLVKNINEARSVTQKMNGKGWSCTMREVEEGFRVWRIG